MKVNVNAIGLAAAIIALVSLALPWWTITISLLGTQSSLDAYTWGVRSTGIGRYLLPSNLADWYRYTTLILIIVGAILGLKGNVTVGRKGWTILAASGILIILAAIIFVAGLATDPALTKASPPISIFESKESALGSISTYLNIGFFLAVTAAILASISLLKHPTASP